MYSTLTEADAQYDLALRSASPAGKPSDEADGGGQRERPHGVALDGPSKIRDEIFSLQAANVGGGGVQMFFSFLGHMVNRIDSLCPRIANRIGGGIQFLSGSFCHIADNSCSLVPGIADRVGRGLQGLGRLLTNAVHLFFDCG
jgi:hypothetical protein